MCRKEITYRDIVSGDYDDTGFLTEQKSIPLVGDYKEVYYYKASYQIPVHYYSDLIYEEESKGNCCIVVENINFFMEECGVELVQDE